MPSRRAFLGSIALPAASLAACQLNINTRRTRHRLAAVAGSRSPERIATDEDYWFEVQRAFSVDRSLINLNNGGVSPAPTWVQNAHKSHLDFTNKAPAYTMNRILGPQVEAVRERLARAWGVGAEEIAITRNASEGLMICQFGFDLERGDEVLTTNQDYPRMISTFEQRERREGIVMKRISIPIPAEDPKEIVRLFEQAITPRTKLILMCHMINLTGQILPVRDVVRMARKRGIPVIVDGAHALAHFDFKLSDLDCDYYATSLHKWLFAPIGTGLLYVRRPKIRSIWPLQAANPELDGDIRKFEQIGTHPIAPYLGIAEALSFHEGIGAKRKEARLVHLRDYWARRLLTNDRVRLHTSLKPGFACGIANFEVDGIDMGKLNGWLFKEHRIIATYIKHSEFRGIRVSPSVYTTHGELDRFCAAVESVIANGLPS